MDDLISIIIPVYKVELKYFKKCISSILLQTYKNLEIVVIIDNNEKQLLEYLKKIKDKRIKIKKINNIGVSNARNIGFSISKGKYICYIDADDYVNENYAKFLYENLIENNSDIAMCSCYIENGNKLKKNYYFNYNLNFNEKNKYLLIYQIINKYPYAKRIKTRIGSVWGKLYKKDFLINNNIYFNENLNKMEDSIYNLYCFMNSNNMSYVLMPLYYYVKRNNSVTNIYDENIQNSFEKFFDELFKYNSLNDNKYKNSINARIQVSIYSYLKLYINNKNNKLSLIKKYHLLLDILQKDYYINAYKKINKKYLSINQYIFVKIIYVIMKINILK